MSINNLNRQVNSKAGQNTILNSHAFKQFLKSEAEKLRGMIVKNIQAYQLSYQPTVYERRKTDNWESLLKVDQPMIDQNTGMVSVKLFFKYKKSWYDSYIYPDDPTQRGFAPWLMEVGWEWKRMPLTKYRFSHFEGISYVYNAVREYNKSNKYNFKISVYYNGELYTDGKKKYI